MDTMTQTTKAPALPANSDSVLDYVRRNEAPKFAEGNEGYAKIYNLSKDRKSGTGTDYTMTKIDKHYTNVITPQVIDAAGRKPKEATPEDFGFDPERDEKFEKDDPKYAGSKYGEAKEKADEKNAKKMGMHYIQRDASLARGVAADVKCVQMLSNMVTPTTKMAGMGMLVGEEVIAQLPIVGFCGGPAEIDGKIGHGMLTLTKMTNKFYREATDASTLQPHEKNKVVHRMHYIMQEHTASFEMKEGLMGQVNDRGEYLDAFGAVNFAYRPEHSMRGEYVVHLVDNEYAALCAPPAPAAARRHARMHAQGANPSPVARVLGRYMHAHAAWQDTAVLASYFEGKFEKKKAALAAGCCNGYFKGCCQPPAPPLEDISSTAAGTKKYTPQFEVRAAVMPSRHHRSLHPGRLSSYPTL